jgi:hypothetical protein
MDVTRGHLDGVGISREVSRHELTSTGAMLFTLLLCGKRLHELAKIAAV